MSNPVQERTVALRDALGTPEWDKIKYEHYLRHCEAVCPWANPLPFKVWVKDRWL